MKKLELKRIELFEPSLHSSEYFTINFYQDFMNSFLASIDGALGVNLFLKSLNRNLVDEKGRLFVNMEHAFACCLVYARSNEDMDTIIHTIFDDLKCS